MTTTIGYDRYAVTMHHSECDTEFKRAIITATAEAWEAMEKTVPMLHPARALYGFQAIIGRHRKQAMCCLKSKLWPQKKEEIPLITDIPNPFR